MRFTSGNKLGTALCEALGLDPKDIRALSIHCTVDSAALLFIERWVDTEQADGLTQILTRYRLVEDEPVADYWEDE